MGNFLAQSAASIGLGWEAPLDSGRSNPFDATMDDLIASPSDSEGTGRGPVG
jgi:hypothetical protein